VRSERNWTNYYAFCRSGLTNDINRIRASAETDLVCLIYTADSDELQFMLNDPLLPQTMKTNHVQKVINEGGWKID